jgi:hypothetical protein
MSACSKSYSKIRLPYLRGKRSYLPYKYITPVQTLFSLSYSPMTIDLPQVYKRRAYDYLSPRKKKIWRLLLMSA